MTLRSMKARTLLFTVLEERNLTREGLHLGTRSPQVENVEGGLCIASGGGVGSWVSWDPWGLVNLNILLSLEHRCCP